MFYFPIPRKLPRREAPVPTAAPVTNGPKKINKILKKIYFNLTDLHTGLPTKYKTVRTT